VPAVVKVYVGFLVADAQPSLDIHDQDVGVQVEVSWNMTRVLVSGLGGKYMNEATGLQGTGVVVGDGVGLTVYVGAVFGMVELKSASTRSPAEPL
jgi:hypothetical protein